MLSVNKHYYIEKNLKIKKGYINYLVHKSMEF